MEFKLDYDPNLLLKEAEVKNEEIAKAVTEASFELRNRARYNMTTTPYKMNKVADKGILLGTLIKDKRNPSIKLHAFGTQEQGYLARIFVSGTILRRTKKGKPTGYIKSIDAIQDALDESILINKINSIL